MRAVSTQVSVKAAKHAERVADDLETKTQEGTAKRNIMRKKTADKDTGNFNSAFKKQGGHGKGQWKEEMDPSYAVKLPIDEKDPIYDEVEDLNSYVLSSCSGGNGTKTATVLASGDRRGYDPATSKAVYGPLLTVSEFKLQFADCVKEYFESCDTDEVIRSLLELGCQASTYMKLMLCSLSLRCKIGSYFSNALITFVTNIFSQEYHPEIVKRAISIAMDKGPRERELTSRLLTCLHPTPLSLEDLEAGFTILLDSMDDLETDVPDAKVKYFL